MEVGKFNRHRWVFLLVCISSGLIFVWYSVRWAPRVTHGFAAYYTYARMLLDGEDLTQVYDYEEFNKRIHEYGMENVRDMPNNIPTNSVVMLPVAWMSPVAAKVSWTVISLIAFGASVALLFHLYGISLRENLHLGILTLVFLWRPIYENVAFGQIYFVLLLLFSLAMYGLKRKNSFLSSAPMAAAVLFKGYGIVPLIWMTFRSYRKEVIFCLVFIILGGLLLLPRIGLVTWQKYYEAVIASLGGLPMHGHTAFQTVNSFITHLFLFDAEWLPAPVLSLPAAVVRGLSYAANIVLIILVVTRSNGNTAGTLLLSFSAVIALGVVTAPLAEEYHYVLFLPLAIGLSAWTVKQLLRTWKIGILELVILTAIIIMALPLNYKFLNSAPQAFLLFAYPKLIAGIVLLFASGSVIRREESVPPNGNRERRA